MTGQTTARGAGGGGAVYGVLQASEINVTAVSNFKSRVALTLPQPIKKLYGLSVILATFFNGESQYNAVTYPGGYPFPALGETIEENENWAWSLDVMEYRGEIEGTGGSLIELNISGNTVSFEYTTGTSDNTVSPRGAAYYYLPE